jgi:hypothetical protein
MNPTAWQRLQRQALGLTLLVLVALPGSAAAAESSQEIRILELQGKVELLPVGASTWVLTQTNQVVRASDRLRTGANSRVALRWSDQTVVPFGELTELEILPPQDPKALAGLHLVKGIVSFFHRDQAGRIRVVTRGAVAGIEGTEFVLAVDEAGGTERTTLSVIEGKVQLSNERGSVTLGNGQQAIVEPGAAPSRTAGFVANNVLQWCFYYPGVLDLEDLPLTPGEQQRLGDSLAAYRQGDLLGALARCPPLGPSPSTAERVYTAQLLLAVGQVEKMEAALAGLGGAGRPEPVSRCADALRQVVAAVKRQPRFSPLTPQLPSELLAASYYKQSRAPGEPSPETALEDALGLAKEAAARSPRWGFAWARVAELEFSFGRTRQAREALDRSLGFSPRNAQALALKGFLLAAENRPRAALGWFDQAIAADGVLANAWLGRGLCRIRIGHAAAGREDLLVATALEPQRALLHSYLGKAFGDARQMKRADQELRLAGRLDPSDPTSRLYSALLKQQQNRVNEAIVDLEASEKLNDNRSLFRSRLLLDEDQATRSANLASIYLDAGMPDVGIREAARAVTYDYASPAAHLFMSDSYNLLRDPTRFNLRYETVWFNELLLANALSPVGGGRLAQNVSQQEYSRLFQADGLGLADTTILRSDNKSVTQLASQYGTYGWTSYAFDLDYQYNGGVRPNNDLADIEWYTTIKQQITPEDTLLALIKYENYHSGDNFQYYYPTNARPNYRFDEYQEPIAVGLWHHEWSPGVHTLVMGGRLENEQQFSDRGARQLLLFSNTNHVYYDHDVEPFDVNYHNQFVIYTAELNQILQWDRVTLSAGGRFQSGTFDTQTSLTNPPGLVPFFFPRAYDATNTSADFQRITGYGYLTVEPLERVWLTGGLAYDDLTYPHNFRYPPIGPGEDSTSVLGPKAALVWAPLPQATLRGMYARSLGGVSLDQSYRLEPTQLAGFPQAFRTVISESAVGSVEAPTFDTYGAAIDLKFPTGTYAGIEFDGLESNVRRTLGVYSLADRARFFVPDSTLETLDYREAAVSFSVNQLLGRFWVLGANYKFDHVDLQDDLPEVPVAALPAARQHLTADLQQAGAYVLFNHPCGFFARAEAIWYYQQNAGYSPALPASSFFQENVYVGWRFAQRRLQLMLGILNLGGQDYNLNPLNYYSELPRERSFFARLDFEF